MSKAATRPVTDGGDRLEVYSRADWGAKPPASPLVPAENPRKKLYWHNTAGVQPGEGWTFEQECSQMRATEAYHVDVRKFRAIAYSFVIFPSGRVYEGRGFEYDHGANLGYENQVSLSFCFAGNYDVQRLTDAQVASAQGLVSVALSAGYLSNPFSNLGHRDEPGVSKSCPGNNVYPRLSELIEEPDDMPDPRISEGMVALLTELLKLPNKADPSVPALPKFVGQRVVKAVQAVEEGKPVDGHSHTVTLSGVTE